MQEDGDRHQDRREHPLDLKQRGVKGVGRIEGGARHDVREEGAIPARHSRRDGAHRRGQEEQEREWRAEADRAGEQRQGAGGDDERLQQATAHLATIQESPAPGRGDSLAQGVDADEQGTGRERAGGVLAGEHEGEGDHSHGEAGEPRGRRPAAPQWAADQRPDGGVQPLGGSHHTGSIKVRPLLCRRG